MVVAFIFIKFIFFPTVSFVTGSNLPIVIVESCSMYHGDNFNNWWNNNKEYYEGINISKENFSKFKLKNGFSKGDIFFVFGTKKQDIKIGDIIIFSSGNINRPIIHRVIDLDPLQTKGDNNFIQFEISNNAERINEKNIQENQLIGKVVGFKVPFVGWLKLIFFEPFRPVQERGFCDSKESMK